MKIKSILIIILSLSLCFILAGCGKKTDNNISNNNEEQQEIEETEEEVNPEVKKAKVWMKLPKNVNLYWKTDVKGTNNYETKTEYKRDNDVMTYVEGVENGVYITVNNGVIGNEYYFYHYQGDYKWTSYCHFRDKGWDTWYFKGVYPASPQSYCFGKPWNILDEYSDEHETVTIEGVGDVDTVKGTDEQGYTYYYSKDLGFNVKMENNVQIWHLIKYDTNVSQDFPYSLPDTKALDAKNTSNETSNESSTQKVVEGEDGEVIVYDE